MASLSLVQAKLNALPAALRAPMLEIFTAILRDVRFGHPLGEQPDPCTNFGAGFFTATTAAIGGDEFTVTHGFGRVPYLAIPVLPLDSVGSQIVPLTVTRAADDRRIYLSSPTASADICLVVEG